MTVEARKSILDYHADMFWWELHRHSPAITCDEKNGPPYLCPGVGRSRAGPKRCIQSSDQPHRRRAREGRFTGIHGSHARGGERVSEERTIARWIHDDLEIEDHGWLILSGHFEYGESGSLCQGWGFFADASFLMRFMGALGVTRLKDTHRKSCWVTRTGGEILLVEPLHRKDGRPFDVREWREWIKGQHQASPHEMLTGERP